MPRDTMDYNQIKHLFGTDSKKINKRKKEKKIDKKKRKEKIWLQGYYA